MLVTVELAQKRIFPQPGVEKNDFSMQSWHVLMNTLENCGSGNIHPYRSQAGQVESPAFSLVRLPIDSVPLLK